LYKRKTKQLLKWLLILIFLCAHETYTHSSFICIPFELLNNCLIDWLSVLLQLQKDFSSCCCEQLLCLSIWDKLCRQFVGNTQWQLSQCPATYEVVFVLLFPCAILSATPTHARYSYSSTRIYGYKSNSEQQQWQVSAIIADINSVQGVSSSLLSWHFSLFKVLAGTQFLFLWQQNRLCSVPYHSKQFNKWPILLILIIKANTYIHISNMRYKTHSLDNRNRNLKVAICKLLLSRQQQERT